MTIPEKHQEQFIKWFETSVGPTFKKFGAKKHELYRVQDVEVIGRQKVERNRFIERVYFDDDYELSSYFDGVKADDEAWKISREYEQRFKAEDVVLRVLEAA